MRSFLLVIFIVSSYNVFADECHNAYFSRDFATALDICKQKATNTAIKDNWEAPLILGNMYERGYGVVANINNAAYWYEMSAKRGNCTAMLDLSLMYANDCARGSYSCQQSKAYYWDNVVGQSCPIDAKNPNFLSNNSRYYSLASQNRPQDFLPGSYK